MRDGIKVYNQIFDSTVIFIMMILEVMTLY